MQEAEHKVERGFLHTPPLLSGPITVRFKFCTLLINLCVTQAELGEVEAGADAVRERFRDLEARMGRVSQVGTRIGDRLQVRHAARQT